MSDSRGNAWVVALFSSDLAECAALSGKMLKKTRTSASIVLIVSPSLIHQAITECSGIFDMILVADVNESMKMLAEGPPKKEQDLLLLSTLKLEQFSTLIVITPGTLVLGQLDHLFDDENFQHGFNEILATNKSGEEWRVARVRPDSNWIMKSWDDLFVPSKSRNGIAKHCEEITSEDELDKYLAGGIVHVNRNNVNAFVGMTLDGESASARECYKAEWVAIVGMSCRFPQANSPEEYWNILEQGLNTCSTPPPHRLALTDLDPKVKANFLKCPIDQFDATFFGISPNEACDTDPQARLLLEVSWEAFEDAGINPADLKGTKTGVFYGSWLQDYKEALFNANKRFLQGYIGNGFGNTAAKLSFFYGFTGPNVFTESACSSSIVAVDMAVNSLQRRECPVALACGGNLFLQTSKQAKVLAEDGKSKTFDVAADGYARAEGIAVLVMKRYTDAVRDHDRIYGVIRGSGSSQEGHSKSFGTPTVESEVCAMERALRAARVSPTQVDYVEAHATGTAVGDPIEAAAIVKAYTSGKRKEPLWIASGKTNIGHAESCSGIAGIIKVLLSMKQETIPRHVNFTQQNPKIDFTPIPGAIPLTSIKWQRNAERPRIAGVTSFGITGTHVHMIIQEAPEKNKASIKSSSQCLKSVSTEKQLLTLSAKSKVALEQLTNSFQTFLGTCQDPLENVTFTANVLRPHHKFCRAVVADTKTEMISKLKTLNLVSSSGQDASKLEISNHPKICFTFPGRLEQNMDRACILNLYNNNTFFRDTINYCHGIFGRVTGNSTPISTFLLSSDKERDAQIEFCLLITLQYSLVKLWEHWGVYPTAVMGHCGGEFSAAVACGVLTLEDVFEMSKVMSDFLQCQRDQPVSMLVLKCNGKTAEELIHQFLSQVADPNDQWIDVSCINSDEQTVVTGPTKGILDFQQFCSGNNIHSKIMSVPYGLHSRAIEPAREKSMLVSNQVLNGPMKIPFVSSLTGKILEEADLDGTYWFRVFREIVNFKQACFTAHTEISPHVYLEIGLGDVLTKLTDSNIAINDKVRPLCVATFPKSGIMSTVAELYTFGVNFKWRRIHERDESSGILRVKLPNYPFQRKSFWFDRSAAKKAMTAESMVHPLLGVTMQTPANMENFTFFQNDWLYQLSNENTRFIRDHIVEGMVLLPAAAFIEMILSAWKCSTENIICEEDPTTVVTNIKIHSPLILEEFAKKQVQCLVDKDKNIVSVFSSSAPSLSWKLHVEAKILLESFDAQEKMETSFDDLKRLTTEGNGDAALEIVEDFYKSLATLGLKFEKSFKSIKAIWNDATTGDTLTQLELNTQDNSGDFICHPILIDAMLQTYIFHHKLYLETLRIPVKVARFQVSLQRGSSYSTGKWYAYCQNNQSSVIKLLDEQFNIVATMVEPQFVATTKQALLSSAGSSISRMNSVSLYLEGWQAARFYQPCNWQKDSERPTIDNLICLMNELQVSLNAFNNFSPDEEQLDQILRKLCRLYVVKAIYDLGWKSNVINPDDIHNPSNDFEKLLGIPPSMIRPFKHYLNTYLKKRDNIPDKSQVDTEIEKILEHPIAKAYPVMDIIHLFGSNLAKILKGTVSTYELMFDDNRLADKFYQLSRLQKSQNALEEILVHLASSSRNGSRLFRVLEIGAGTGVVTRGIIKRLRENGVTFEYHFTDVSSTLTNNAKNLFSAEVDKDRFVFKTLNIDQNPLVQGFPPVYFDLVVAYDALHATINLKNTLYNVALLTKIGGSVLLCETEGPIAEIDICFGTLEEYWRFEDDIRQDFCTVNADTWIQLMSDACFSGNPCKVLSCGGQKSIISAVKNDSFGRIERPLGSTESSWILLNVDGGKEVEQIQNCIESMTNRHVFVLNADLEGNELNEFLEEILFSMQDALEGILLWMTGSGRETEGGLPNSRKCLESLLYLSKHLIKFNLSPTVVLVTQDCWQNVKECSPNGRGVASAQAWGFMRNLRLESPKLRSMLIDLEYGVSTNEQAMQIITNMWLDDDEVEVKYVEGTRCVRRLCARKKTTPDLSIPEKGQYRIKLPNSKSIGDVKFVSVPEEKLCGTQQVRVEVRSVSLNFKDVLAILKPSQDFQQLSSIGLDFSGVVVGVGANVNRWQIGDQVFGCDLEGKCMQSQVVVDENGVIALPPGMTFTEAATLPAVFLTAWHCMVNVAKVQKGQIILVHAAAGGVGLAAIQIAKLLGVTVFGTAGSERKRRFLKSLGLEQVYSSRNVEFKKMIQNVTQDRAVDTVLNCLTGPGFKEASLEVCRDGGHFVEISKLDIWTEEEVKKRRPLVKYNIVDMTKVDGEISFNILSTLASFLKEGKVVPLHHTVYPATRLVDALVHLQKAKQIGKAVIKMPERFESERTQLLFNDRSTYIITGGMGGVGFAICEWMLRQGAKHIVLVGRSEPNEEISKEIAKLHSDYNAEIITKQLDVSDYQNCENFIRDELPALKLPPLRGIHHTAVTLSDKMIASQEWPNFEIVLNAKVNGAWNLHRCTLNLPLEFFVLHSSAVATFGNMGQSNYAAANAYLDSLAKYRHSCGLAGMSINWGAWKTGLSEHIKINWTPHFTVEEGILTLERIMKEYPHESNIVAGTFNMPLIMERFPRHAAFLENLAVGEQCSTGGSLLSKVGDENKVNVISSREFADKYLLLEDVEARYGLVRNCLLQIICEVMGNLEDVSDDVPLSEVGMDSLMSIEINNKVSALLEEVSWKMQGEGNKKKKIDISNEDNTTLLQMSKYVSSYLQELGHQN